jgi:predicted nucleic-acid-binding protein
MTAAKHPLRSVSSENELSVESHGYVSLVALLETVWIMESRFEADRPTVADILNDLLNTTCWEVQEAQSVRDATACYRDGGVDLHDALIASLAGKRGAQVVTFDKKAARELGMTMSATDFMVANIVVSGGTPRSFTVSGV